MNSGSWDFLVPQDWPAAERQRNTLAIALAWVMAGCGLVVLCLPGLDILVRLLIGAAVFVNLAVPLWMGRDRVKPIAVLLTAQIFGLTVLSYAIEGGISTIPGSWLPFAALTAAYLLGWRYAVAVTALFCGFFLVVIGLQYTPFAAPNLAHPIRNALIEVPLSMGVCGLLVAYERASRTVVDSSMKETMRAVAVVDQLEARVNQLETERAEQEAALQKAMALAPVHNLAGGIAHDFNNLLTAILVHAGVAADQVQDEEIREDLEVIKRAAQGAAEFSRRMLMLSSRIKGTKPIPIEPTTVLRDLCRLLQRMVGDEIDLIVEIPERLPIVELVPGHLEQVVLNLVVNARDAMDGSGTIRVTAAATTLGLRIEVDDTGCGMDEDTLASAFEPFFTTKGPEHGTGLGLSVVRRITRTAGGRVTAKSQVGEGTRFILELPASGFEAIEGEPTTEERALTGGERLLVVDDDPQVLRVCNRVLQHYGYSVVLASDVPSALTAYDRQHVDLILTDVVMRDQGGMDLAQGIQERGRGTPVVFMSGYLGQAGVDHGIKPLVIKPFEPQDLAGQVRATLDARDR